MAGRLAGEEVCLMILTTSFIGQLLQAEGGRGVKGRRRGIRKAGSWMEKGKMGSRILFLIKEISYPSNKGLISLCLLARGKEEKKGSVGKKQVKIN